MSALSSGVKASGASTAALAALAATQTLATGLPTDLRLDPAADRSVARECWADARAAKTTGQTAGLAPGFVQANLVIVPQRYAFDFLRFCLLNPVRCWT